jgi:predicted permease
VRQLLTESALLALCGTVLGLLFARWGTGLIPAVGLPALSFFAHGRVMLFAIAAALACVLVFGLVPALAATRAELASTLKEGVREGVDHRSRLRSALMVVQVALATVLLVGAGLFVHSLRNVQAIEPGMDVTHLLVGSVDLRRAGYTATTGAALLHRVVERVRRLPGVRGAALVSRIPLSGGFSILPYTVPDGTSGLPSSTLDLQQAMQGTRAIALTVGPRYFTTVGTPILAGREFTEQDRTGRARVVIVNQAFADREWPGARALGRCVNIGFKENMTCYRVVGVVATAKYVNLEEPSRPAFFEPASQTSVVRVLLMRTTDDPAALAPSVRRALAEVDPTLGGIEVKTLTDVLRPELQPRWLGASMFSAFGLLALVLAAVGLYGVVSYGVEQRTHDLGVRMALGARPAQVRRLVVRQGMVLTLAGLAIGTCGALALSRFVTHLLYGVTATDPITFVAVGIVLAAVALLASLIPAGRAANVDPIVALRNE